KHGGEGVQHRFPDRLLMQVLWLCNVFFSYLFLPSMFCVSDVPSRYFNFSYYSLFVLKHPSGDLFVHFPPGVLCSAAFPAVSTSAHHSLLFLPVRCNGCIKVRLN